MALAELRRFAQGIYPRVLAEYGLVQALNAAALRTTLPTTVRSVRIGRYAPDVEAAVYFCCVEALQNANKHAGPDAAIIVRLRCDGGTLRFEVADTGIGFDQRFETDGTGLTHMRDRIGAVGGHTTISSTPGHGTLVSGAITIA